MKRCGKARARILFWVCKLYQVADTIITWANWSLRLNSRILWIFVSVMPFKWWILWSTNEPHKQGITRLIYDMSCELLRCPCQKFHVRKQNKKLRSVILSSLMKLRSRLITELLNQERVWVISQLHSISRHNNQLINDVSTRLLHYPLWHHNHFSLWFPSARKQIHSEMWASIWEANLKK